MPICQVAEKEANMARQEEDRNDQRRKGKSDKKTQKKVQKRTRFGEKRKAEPDDYQDEWNENSGKAWFELTNVLFLRKNQVRYSLLYPICYFSVTEQAPKRHRGNGDHTTEEHMETEAGLFGRNAPPGFKPKKAPQGAAATAPRQNDDKPELRNDKSSVFISNLAYTLEEPEAKLRTLFEPCGPITQVRPVFGNKGSFKGYGYVQFESLVSVAEALKLDRREMEGRPMFVSPCVDKNKNPDFKVNMKTSGQVCFYYGHHGHNLQVLEMILGSSHLKL